jgi:hypothetical protein
MTIYAGYAFAAIGQAFRVEAQALLERTRVLVSAPGNARQREVRQLVT